MTELIFTPETHNYTVDGRPLVSVTQCLCYSGVVDTTWYNDWGRERGSAVHKAIEYHNDGDLDYDSLDPNIVGYFDAYLKFKEQKRWFPSESELHVYDSVRGFAGTLDALGIMKNLVTIVDFKTGPLTRAVGLQLSGYAIALKATWGTVARQLVGIQLKIDGTYKIKSYPFEPKVFLATLEVSRWLNSN